ncbi:hypothetical protein EVAR_68532_1 [Eumeta japonica]|uniref:Uncharacterized protein n=1 Tax=Eumeta variegata TaxID=151549 RepID=A0A4C1SQA4_EUMVA|nr:hypothetical protein EVAR_68532_1 [Eumeta japonica]
MYVTQPHRGGDTRVRRRERKVVCSVYWRVKLSENETAVSLIIGKARVAPLDTEIRSTDFIDYKRSEVKPVWKSTYLRDDSICHRLAELEEHTTVKCGRWGSTKLNDIDDATRGPPTDFNETHWWFRGPDFLRKKTKMIKWTTYGGGKVMYDFDTSQ